MHDDTLDGQLPQIDIGEPMEAYIGDLDENGVPLTTGGLKVKRTGEVINGREDLTIELKTKSGTLIGEEISMEYVDGTNGHYSATIPSTLTILLKDGVEYHVWYLCDTIVHRKLEYRAGFRGHQ